MELDEKTEGPGIEGYIYRDDALNASHGYLVPTLDVLIARHASATDKRIFDLGCGNGSVSAHVAQQGYEVVGVDPSSDGIAQANRSYPQLRLELGSAYDPLEEKFGQFPLVYSLEVVEHVYPPRDYARTLAALLQPGGVAIVSTPYHSYLKNLALALSGKMEGHFTALWDHGHIKFWSVATLSELLHEAGLEVIGVERVGRVPTLAKSMILVARKPK